MWANNFVGQEGFIAREPEECTTNSGKLLKKFTIFISKGKDEARQSAPMDIILWESVAERFNGQKGDLVKVIGMLNPEEWEDKQTGKKRYKFSITGEEVTIKWRKEQTEMQMEQTKEWTPKAEEDGPLPF